MKCGIDGSQMHRLTDMHLRFTWMKIIRSMRSNFPKAEFVFNSTTIAMFQSEARQARTPFRTVTPTP